MLCAGNLTRQLCKQCSQTRKNQEMRNKEEKAGRIESKVMKDANEDRAIMAIAKIKDRKDLQKMKGGSVFSKLGGMLNVELRHKMQGYEPGNEWSEKEHGVEDRSRIVAIGRRNDVSG